ncbi:MAG: MMPL family transporter [Candidatus Calescibacterium sp.]|nr:MMPL family transporter [Candidatus Calescibacterium sp.]MDW8087868.1 MMPL family transporter [Candidatus Calescibacterium sp.]
MLKRIWWKVLDFVSDLPVKFYWFFVPLFLVLAIISANSAKKMVIKLSFFDELPADHPQVIRYKDVAERYGGVDMVFFVIQSDNLSELKQCAGEIESSLKAMEEIKSVRGRMPVDFLKQHALFFVERDNLNELEDFLKRREKEFSKLFEDLDFIHFIKNWSALMESEILQREDVGDEKEFVESITNIRNWIELIKLYFESGQLDEGKYRSFFRKAFLIGSQTNNSYEYDIDHEYMLSKDLTTISVFAIPVRPSDDYNFNKLIYKKLFDLKENLQKGVCSNEKIYLGGTYVALEEQRLITLKDMRTTTLLSGVLGIIIFILIFRGIGGIVIIGSAIAVGLALTFGFLMLVYGYITVISALFGAFLIGLGVDFQAYVFSRWKELIQEIPDPKKAMRAALRSVIPPMLIGATTTSAAFFSVTISEIRGSKILGVIAGSGIIIYLITSVFFTSSLIILLRKILVKEKALTLDYPLMFISRLVSRFSFPFLIIFSALLLTGIFGLSKFGFEYNLRKILPSLPAIEAEDKIIEKFGRPKDYTIFVFEDLESLDRKIKEIEQKTTVKMIESIRIFYPSDISEKLPIVESVYDVVYDIKLGKKPDIPSVLESGYVAESFGALKKVSSALVELSILSGTFQGENEAKKLSKDIEDIINILLSKKYVDLTTLQIVNSKVVSDMLIDLKLASESRGFGISDIPEDIRKTFVGKDGSFIVFVYPKRAIWEDENYMRLIKKEMEDVDPKSFSIVSVFLNVTDRVKKDFVISLSLAFVLVFALVFAGFRNLGNAILAIIPVLSSLIITSGIASLLGIKIHYINMGAYALLLGVGVDYGVHIVHRLIEEGGDVRKAIGGTGRAILIAAITTMIGFGSMLAAHFPGLKDLGEILTIGIFFSAVVSIVFMPVIFGFISRKFKIFQKTSH